MKPFALVALASFGLAGCSLFGLDCSFDSVPTREQHVEALALVSLPDTVVLALVVPGELSGRFYLEPYSDPRYSLQGDSVRVRGTITTREASPDFSARLDVRGDTVFVSLDTPLVRQACSPPPVPGEGFIEVDLPAGVVVRQSVTVPQGPRRASGLRSDPFRPLLRA